MTSIFYRFNRLIIIVFTLVAVIACNKNDSLITDEITNNSVAVDYEKLEEDNPNFTFYNFSELKNIVQNFGEKYAIFETINEASSFIISFGALNQEKRNEILSLLNYETINNHINALYDEINIIDNEEELRRFVSENQDYLKIITDGNGKEEIVPIDNVSKHNFRYFLNRDQIIKIGNDFVKYLDDIKITNPDYYYLQQSNNKDDFINQDSTVIKVVKSYSQPSNTQIAELRGQFGYNFWEYIRNPSGCKNDRKIEFSIKFVENINEFYDPGLGWTMQVLVTRSATLKGRRKGIPCIWYSYKTNLKWKNFKFKYREYYNPNHTEYYDVTWVEPDIEKEAKVIERWNNVRFYIANWGEYYYAEWTSKRSSLNSRGIDHWVEIDE